jgi:DNA-directed RNA polymerase specialized sigma24 family protein
VRRERLLAALDTITGEERLVLALLVYEGLTVDETARLLEIDPRTVQANCDRLLTELHRAVSGTRRRPSRAIPRETERAVLRRAM